MRFSGQEPEDLRPENIIAFYDAISSGVLDDAATLRDASEYRVNQTGLLIAALYDLQHLKAAGKRGVPSSKRMLNILRKKAPGAFDGMSDREALDYAMAQAKLFDEHVKTKRSKKS